VKNMTNIFNNCPNLTNLYFENIDLPQITKIENMFYLSYNLKNISFININISKTTIINGLFKNQNNLENNDIKNLEFYVLDCLVTGFRKNYAILEKYF
jgi:hypothetical protein